METKWNAFTASTWIINSIYLFSAQLMGGGVFCGFLILAERLYTYRSAWKALSLFWGGHAAVWKIDHWKCVGKWHGWIRRGMEQAFGEWNGAILAVCVWIDLWEDYSRKAKWNDCVDCGMERLIHLCCAVLRWVKWTERNVVKGGRVVRHEQRPPKRNEWRE